jgi:hypothetical protein
MSTNVTHYIQPIVIRLANALDMNAPIPHTRDDAGAFEPFAFPAFMELTCLSITGKNGSTRYTGLKLIPKLFSAVRLATGDDIEAMVTNLFDSSRESTITRIGKVSGTENDIMVNLSAMFQLPSGIFGKTGKGKTVTAKDLIIAAISNECFIDYGQNKRPVQFIVFDAQGEYAFGNPGDKIGLNIVADKIHQLSIDLGSIQNKAFSTALFIDPSEMDVDDWLAVFWDATANMDVILHEMESLRAKDRAKNGISETNKDLPRFVEHVQNNLAGHEDFTEKYPKGTVNALFRRMRPFNTDKFRAFLREPPNGLHHVMSEIDVRLTEGKSIIVHFGQFSLDKSICATITNYITRQLYDKYSGSINDPSTRLPHLVLVIEEAHRFVGKNVEKGIGGSEYISKIARETRKFGLVPCLVDQRPSGIVDEIVSQLASRVVHRLDDPDDVKAALSGMNKTRWIPLVNSLGQGDAIFFGDIIGDVPMVIKPFYKNDASEMRRYFNIRTITPPATPVVQVPVVVMKPVVRMPERPVEKNIAGNKKPANKVTTEKKDQPATPAGTQQKLVPRRETLNFDDGDDDDDGGSTTGRDD